MGRVRWGNVSQDNLVGLIPGRSVKTISNEFGLYSAGWRDTEFLEKERWARANPSENAVGSRRGDKFQETEARGTRELLPRAQAKP